MGKAFKCDATGVMVEGAPVREVFVTVGGLEIHVRPYVRVNERERREADVSPEFFAKVEKALAALAGKKG